MRGILTTLFVVLSFSCRAKDSMAVNHLTIPEVQKSGDNGGYELKRNAPEDLPKFAFIAYPLMLHAAAYGPLAYALGAEANYKVLPWFTAFGSGFAGIGKGSFSASKDGSALKRFDEINIGGAIYFKNRTKSTDERVSAWYKKGFKLKPYYVNVPIHHISRLGIEAGWYNTTSIVNGQTANLAGYELNDPSRKRYSLYMKGNSTSLTSTCYFIGLNSVRLNDYLVQFDDDRLEDQDLRAEDLFYIDLLFPVSASYTNLTVTDANVAPPGTYNLNTYTGKRRTGFRAGFMLSVMKAPGICWGLEVGAQPAVTKDALYVGFKFGLGWHY
jgi:hypothetical protein